MTPAKALAERLRAADSRWDDKPEPAGTYWPWLAAEALAWFREQRPTREDMATAICNARHYDAIRNTTARYCVEHSRCLQAADAILALFEKHAEEREG